MKKRGKRQVQNVSLGEIQTKWRNGFAPRIMKFLAPDNSARMSKVSIPRQAINSVDRDVADFHGRGGAQKAYSSDGRARLSESLGVVAVIEDRDGICRQYQSRI